ncbi:MAG: T9SS type A sorting domain-containing protein [Bacteroidota bacterium]|nr:T9SS type A sorting domain-containing protein [Bacteroidota bacterium]
MKRSNHLPETILFLFFSMNAAAQSATQGFFLNEWQTKNITVTDYIDVAKPAASTTLTVTVDAGTILTKVPKYLFGNNSNTWSGQMVTETDLLTHLTNLSPNVIRAPGGSISDVYFWNTTQKPADAPDSLVDANGNKVVAGYWYGGNTASWTLAISNYYNMLQQTGNTGIITVDYAYARYGTGPNPVAAAAHLAANWVRYDNGRTKFWEIGNECNGTWEASYRIDPANNHDGQPAIITGSLYGQHFKVFADSMRAAAQQTGATIYIGAYILEQAPQSWQTPTDQTWNQGVIGQVNNVADFYIVHSYFTPYNTNSNATDILNSGTTNTQNIMNYLNTNIPANGGSLKPVALTEWNISAVSSMQMVSHIAGLHADIVLGELIKNKYGQASRWDLANGWNNGDDMGLFNEGDEPGGIPKWNPRPAFYHLYYFQKYCGDQMVNSTTGNTAVLSYATTFSSGQIGLVIINKTTSPQTVKIDFQNFTPGNRYYWYTLSGSNDNGEFSRKVMVNGNPPTNSTGGPLTYATIKPNSAVCNNDVRVTLPDRSAIFVLIEKSSTTTGITDIDPANKLVQLINTPSPDGSFTLKFNGFAPADNFDIEVSNMVGQIINTIAVRNTQLLRINKPLPAGMYFIKVQTKKGTTVKKLIVN